MGSGDGETAVEIDDARGIGEEILNRTECRRGRRWRLVLAATKEGHGGGRERPMGKIEERGKKRGERGRGEDEVEEQNEGRKKERKEAMRDRRGT